MLSVSPTSAAEGERVEVVVMGEGFVLRPKVNLGGEHQAVLEGAVVAEIGGVQLEALVLLSAHELRGVLPAGLSPGAFDVVVSNGFGRRSELARAFSIDPANPADGGEADGGASDAGGGDADAGTSDAGGADAGPTDAGDAGPVRPDAGSLDGGAADAGGLDAGDPDAGSADAGSADAGSADAGSADAGSADAGSTDAGADGGTDAGGSDAGELVTLFVDPFGDGTSGTFVFGYGGKVYVGPNGAGARALRFDPSGANPEPITFSFSRDITGNTSANTSAAPYPSIGATGCVNNTPACGPDNENGRGLFFETRFADAGWLGAAGAKSGQDFDYIYLSGDTDARLDFSYVDLSAFLGAGTRELSSAFFFGGRTYLGYGGTAGARRPGLVALSTAPTSPGLDATAAVATDLLVDQLPGISNGGGATNNIMLDAMGVLNDRLYLGAYGGWVRSTTAQPGPVAGDWTSCTPSAAPYSAKTSTTTTRAADLEPADRAIPAFASYGGRLYAARNTTTGPQLWACDPALTVSPTDCDPGDWYLVAPNSTGDLQLTQFNDPANTHLTLLRASSTHLYVAFNNTVRGTVLFRSVALAPTARVDFTGAGDCSALQYPASCQSFGGNGLGAGPAVSRIIDSVVFSGSGTDFLFVVGGDGTTAARVVRVGP